MPLLYEKRGAVGILTLSRPQSRNAWGEDYNAALKELLPQIEEDSDIRCVVLTGDEAGGAFSAGADLKNPKSIPATRSPMRSRPCPSGGGIRQ